MKTREKTTRSAVKNMRTKESKDLVVLLGKKRLDLTKFQVKILSGKEKNLKTVKIVKKEIAQLLTIIEEKSRTEKDKNK